MANKNFEEIPISLIVNPHRTLNCFRFLSENENRELNAWLNEIGVCNDATALANQFSDGHKMALVLKKFHPKLVNMPIYSHRDALVLKKVNYELLNFKVLRRLGMSLSKEALDNLTEAVPGQIEHVLYDIMKYAKKLLQNDSSDDQLNYENDLPAIKRSEVHLVTMKVENGSQQQLMIPYAYCDLLMATLQQKDDLLKTMQQYLKDIEASNRLKEERIEQLLIDNQKMRRRNRNKVKDTTNTRRFKWSQKMSCVGAKFCRRIE